VEGDTSDGKGLFLRWLPEGEYRVEFKREIGLDPTPARKLIVAPGKTQDSVFAVPSLPYLDLRSERLEEKKIPGWNFMAIPNAMAAQAAGDEAPAMPEYSDQFEDVVYGEDWFAETPVPADLGWGDPKKPDITMPIENNSYFWYRMHFTIPASWGEKIPNRDLILTGFQVDDSDWTYFNGQVIGMTLNHWDKRRTYVIPRNLVRWDQDNVIAIKGYQGTGGAGIVGDGPFALEMKPLETVASAFSKGDLDGSGAVNMIDVTMALQAAVGLKSLDADALGAGDLNGNGKVEVDEVVQILKAVVGIQPL
jgi:hypothetical protein